VCAERAASELGWRARTPYAEGVRRYVAWHREHAARAQEPTVAPAPEAPPAIVAAARTRLRAGAVATLQRFTAVASGVLALVLYVVVLHAAGLSNDGWHTVLVVAVLGLAASVSTHSTSARVAVWLTALAGAALLIPAGPSAAMDFARLNIQLLILGLAGAGIGLLGVAGGKRTVLEPSFANRSEP
jgi:hypothetical protein